MHAEEQSRPSGPQPSTPAAEVLPQGAEAPPPGVRTMALVRWGLVGLMLAAAAAAWIYVVASPSGRGAHAAAAFHCPMHPSVVQEHPGECPICGMDLVPVSGRSGHEHGSGAASGAGEGGVAPAASATAPGAHAEYTCPMHPAFVVDDPNARCPECGMKLVPRAGGAPPPAHARAPVPGLVPVSLSPERVQLIGMRTAPAARRSLAPELRTVGFVTADENRLASVTVRYSGYVKELRVKGAVARVRKGEVLATVYSPELITPQLAFVNTVRWSKAAGASAATQPAQISAGDDPRRRLLLLGVSEQDLREMERTLQPLEELKIRSPIDGWAVSSTLRDGSYVEPGTEMFQIADLSRVWVIADVYEHELARVRVGQRARLVVAAVPGRTFEGRVEFLYPALNPGTRTLQARLELANPDLALRPGMYGDVFVELGRAEALAIPAEALVETGDARYVFVAGEGGRLEPRAVRVGARAEGFVEVLEGVSEGEAVVTTGNFLVDSESRLRAALESFAGGTP